MSQNLKNSIEKLNLIAGIRDKKLQKKLLSSITKNRKEFEHNFNAIREICCNYLNKNIPYNKKLNKYKKLMKKISGKKLSKRIKEKIFVQNGGFLSALLPIVGSFLINQLT